MTQYDNIAEQYDQSAEDRSDRAMILLPSAKHYLGNLRGKRVLDLACGSGYFTRLIKSWGADRVLGVDISSEMIELAQQREHQNRQDIEYVVANVSKTGKLGDFDVVFAGFLFHYSKSIDELNDMCKGVSANLAKGGRLVCFNENAAHPLHEGIKYGVAVKAFGEIVDGVKIERTHYKGDQKDFSFEHYHYQPSTYTSALNANGFSDVSWKPFVPPDPCPLNFDADYWKDYLGDFSIAVFTACKT